MSKPKPVKVIAVTSGKGGVGKTNVSVNLGTALGRMGKGVMLLDADLGLANVDVMLGLSPKLNLSHVLDGSAGLEEVLVDGPEGMHIIPASSGMQRMAELSSAEHAGLIRSFSELSHDIDYLIVDTAAGISDSVMSFARASREVIVVAVDEPSSITDAYALIKVLNRDHGVQRFNMVANRVSSAQHGQSLFDKLTRVTGKFLDLTMDYAGAIPEDEAIRKAIQRQKTVVEAYPGSPAGKAFEQLARRVDKWPMPSAAEGYLEFFVERLIQYGSNAGEAV
ncbi:MinD/ParA family protein [Ectothiorhodospiraceae bacterium WFHF3C12]|nr:MinD/ParA family protein [Ectothiorhodospiraceae bacterium WFHF3C12]